MAFSRNTIFSSLIWKLLERFSVQFLTFIITVVLARILMPEDYGIIAIITVFISVADVIIDGGLNTALVQKKDSDNKDFATILIFSLGASFVLYALMYFCAPFIADFYNNKELTNVVRVLSVSLFFYAINSVQRAFVSKNMLFKKLFYCTLLSVFISGFVGIVLAYRNLGVWALVAQNILNLVCNSIFLFVFVKWFPKLQFSLERFKRLFSFGWKMFLTNMIINIFDKLRTLVIGRMYSASTLAYYDRGNQFSNLIIGNINTSIQAVVFPALSAVQDEFEKIKSMMRRATQISCFFIFPLTVVLIIMAEPIVRLLLTDKWIQAVPFIQILCLSSLFKPLTLANLEAIKAMGHSNIVLKLEVIKTSLNALILAISCLFGVYAIAWGMVVFNVACVFINLYPNIRLLNYSIKEQLADIAPYLLISILMGLVIYPINQLIKSPFAIIIVQSLLGCCVYLLACHFLKTEGYLYVKEIVVNYLKSSKLLHK